MFQVVVVVCGIAIVLMGYSLLRRLRCVITVFVAIWQHLLR
jgi:hypothetical protein